MITRTKMCNALAMLAITGMFFGCGGGSSSTSGFVQSGKLVQGPVVGATIFADSKSGSRFVLDGSEISATTDANGSYAFPSLPTYDYILVSNGGTDKTTGLPAIQMMAPAGAQNITPLTTLVALDESNPTMDPTKGALAKIQSLLPAGVKYDADVSEKSSPAVLLLVKSIETASKSLTDAITTQTGKTIAPAQNAYIQAQIMQSISKSVATSNLDLTIPTNVNTILTAALDQAVTNINTVNSNVSIAANTGSVTTGSLIATNSVNVSATVLGITDQAAALSTTTEKKEATLPQNSPAMFQNAVASTVGAVIPSTTISTVITPNPASFPSIPTVTVPIAIVATGASGSTGSTGSGISF